MQYVGKLMRRWTPSPSAKPWPPSNSVFRAQDALKLHQAEHWRARLIFRDDNALQAFIDAHVEVDIQQLRSLVRAARKDASGAPRSAMAGPTANCSSSSRPAK